MNPWPLETRPEAENLEAGLEMPDAEPAGWTGAPRAAPSEFRVAHVLRKFDPAEWGGTETAIRRLTAGLREHGVESVVYCPRLDGAGPGTTSSAHSGPARAGRAFRAADQGLEGARIRRFRTFLPIWGLSPERRRQMIAVGGNLMSLDLPLTLCRDSEAAVIHAHALGRLGGIAATAARVRRLPLVVTIHGGFLDLPPALKNSFANGNRAGFEWGKIFGLFLQARRVLARADAILTCNPNEARLLRDKFPRQRIHVQPHGIPVALYRRDCRDRARAAFPQIHGRQVLLCVGRIDPVKNQDWLVARAPEIFGRHSRALLVLAGACTNESYGVRLKQQIRELGLEEKILLAGGLPPDDARLVGLFQEAQAVILPSISETFGLVLLEAWAAGATVISSRTSGASALVRPGENGWLFHLNDPGAFHEAVTRTLQHPELRERQAAAGRRLVESEFSVPAVAARVKKLYAELIGEKTAAGARRSGRKR